MVWDTIPERQSLVSLTDTVASGGGGVGTVERRRGGTIIPLDKGNSRMLRRSINSYLGQASEVQEELTRLEKRIGELVVYVEERVGGEETPTRELASQDDDQMHEVEERMSLISSTGLKVKSLLRHMEPKKETADQTSTIDRRGSQSNRISVRHTQYHALALMVYASMSSYKQIIDKYYAKLTASPQLINNSWSKADSTPEEKEEDGGSSGFEEETDTPLLEADAITSLLKVKQRLISQEYEIHARERRIREWHKLASSTFQSRHNTDTDSIRSAYTCTTSPTATISYDAELCLKNPYDDNTTTKISKNRWRKMDRSNNGTTFSPIRCVLAFLLTIVITAAIIVGVYLTLYFTHFKGAANMTYLDDAQASSITNTTSTNYIDITESPKNTTSTSYASTGFKNPNVTTTPEIATADSTQKTKASINVTLTHTTFSESNTNGKSKAISSGPTTITALRQRITKPAITEISTTEPETIASVATIEPTSAPSISTGNLSSILTDVIKSSITTVSSESDSNSITNHTETLEEQTIINGKNIPTDDTIVGEHNSSTGSRISEGSGNLSPDEMGSESTNTTSPVDTTNNSTDEVTESTTTDIDFESIHLTDYEWENENTTTTTYTS